MLLCWNQVPHGTLVDGYRLTDCASFERLDKKCNAKELILLQRLARFNGTNKIELITVCFTKILLELVITKLIK